MGRVADLLRVPLGSRTLGLGEGIGSAQRGGSREGRTRGGGGPGTEPAIGMGCGAAELGLGCEAAELGLGREL